MGKDNFEKYIQEQFHDHRLAVNTEEIWSAVEKELPKTDRPFPWLGISLSALVILLTGFLLFSLSNNSSSHSKSLAITSSNNTAPENKPSNTVVIPVNENDKASSETKNYSPSSEENIETPLSSPGSSSIVGNSVSSNVTFANSGQKRNNVTTGFSNEVLRQQESKSTSGSEINTGSLTAGSEATKTTTSADNKSFANLDHNDHGNTVFSSIEENEQKFAAVSKSLSITEERTTIPSISLLRSRFVVDALDDQSSLTLSLPELKNCYSFANKSLAISMDLYTGLHYAHKNLSNTSSGLEEYANSRSNTESYLEAFDAGLGINFIHRKGYMLSTGINFRQINEEFNFFAVQTETRFDSIVVRIEIDSAGMADTIRAWRPVTVRRSQEILTYNSYQMVDIPLSLGYQFHKGDWTIEAQAGAMFNVLYRQRGEVLDPNLNVVNIEQNKLIKDRIGISAYLGIKALYPLNERLSVYAEPYARVNLKDITVDGYALNQTYNSFGLRFGGRISF